MGSSLKNYYLKSLAVGPELTLAPTGCANAGYTTNLLYCKFLKYCQLKSPIPVSRAVNVMHTVELSLQYRSGML